MKHLIKHEYPNLKNSEYKKACDFINGKCSQYYFIGYLKCSNGNVNDAIEFAKLDDELRSFLMKYLLRFEIQLKADFAELVFEKTHDSSFWKRKKYYLPDTIKCKKKGITSKYFLIKKKITSCIKRLNYNTIGPQHLVAMYTCPFGTFQELFKCIGRQYKSDFIQKYTKNLEITGYKILNTYFESIRKIRNRCAHGNHIITTKILFELNNLKFGMTQKKDKNAGIVIEKTFDFIFDNLYCGKECEKELSKILHKYIDLLIKYAQNHSMPIKLFKHIDEK